MTSWIAKLVAVIILTSCCEMILPTGKTKSACITVLTLICLVVMVDPIFKIRDYNLDFSEILPSVQVDQTYLDTTNEYYANILENEVSLLLLKNGVKIKECNILGNIESGEFIIKKITVKFDKIVISGKDEHIITIEEIKQLLVSSLKIDKDNVFVYGE